MIERILELAKEKGVKLGYIEKQIGGYRGKVSDWKLRRSSPSAEDLRIIADLLGTSEAYLRGDTDDARPVDQQELDELEWAMLDASHDLTDDQKRAIIQMIKAMKE